MAQSIVENKSDVAIIILLVVIVVMFSPSNVIGISTDSVRYISDALNLWDGGSIFRIGFTSVLSVFLNTSQNPLIGAMLFIRLILFLSVLIIILISWKISGLRTAWIAVLLLLSSPLLHFINTRILLDGYIVFFIGLALYFCFISLLSENKIYTFVTSILMFIASTIKVIAIPFFFVPLLFFIFRPNLWPSSQVRLSELV